TRRALPRSRPEPTPRRSPGLATSLAGSRRAAAIRPEMAPARSPASTSPVVLVVFALAIADAQLRPQGRASGVQLRMRVERRLVGPALQQRQLVGIENALEDLELLAAGLLHALLATRFIGLRQFRTLARRGGDRDDESDG